MSISRATLLRVSPLNNPTPPIRVIVYEDSGWQKLLPLTYTRPACQLLCGAGSLLERVVRLAGELMPATDDRAVEVWTRPILADLVREQTGRPVNCAVSTPTLLLNGRGLWNSLPQIDTTAPSWIGRAGPQHEVACVWINDPELTEVTHDRLIRSHELPPGLPERDVSGHVELLEWPWTFINRNHQALVDDWELVRPPAFAGRQPPAGVHVLAPEMVTIGDETRIKPGVVVDAEDGPVWIGRNVTILPHSFVQGPAYIGDDCLIQPGAVIHAGTTIGPRCKVGGEIDASIIQGFSNKQHDGFLGHSYIGSWVNIAADCINSDLKNTYGKVRVPIVGKEVDSGEMFVGMIVGDHSKTGINVSFPTGAVVGFCSSIFTPMSPKFVPSFSWIDGDTIDRYDEERGVQLAQRMMARRDRVLTSAEEAVFRFVRRQALALEHPVMQ